MLNVTTVGLLCNEKRLEIGPNIDFPTRVLGHSSIYHHSANIDTIFAFIDQTVFR